MFRASAIVSAAVLAAAAPVVQQPRYLHRQPNEKSTYEIKLINDEADCEVVKAQWGQIHRLAETQVYTTSVPDFLNEENGEDSKQDYVQIYAPTALSAWGKAAELCRRGLTNSTIDEEDARLATKKKTVCRDTACRQEKRDIEIRPIRETGPSSNRIDVVFMGDGYMMDERAKHFEDMERLTDDMWGDVTFASFLPVFNIWALHEESAETGIGVNSQPRDTAYRLYRDGTQLRGIFPGNAQNARDNCALAPGCEFPSIIGNDPFYGGLGGEFVIATESLTSGTIVLRHEMGHNFINVGEECVHSLSAVSSAARLPLRPWQWWWW